MKAMGFNPELEELALKETSDHEGRNASSENSLTDTSDPDQAMDADELVDVGSPVYFNFAVPNNIHPLQVRQICN